METALVVPLNPEPFRGATGPAGQSGNVGPPGPPGNIIPFLPSVRKAKQRGAYALPSPSTGAASLNQVPVVGAVSIPLVVGPTPVQSYRAVSIRGDGRVAQGYGPPAEDGLVLGTLVPDGAIATLGGIVFISRAGNDSQLYIASYPSQFEGPAVASPLPLAAQNDIDPATISALIPGSEVSFALLGNVVNTNAKASCFALLNVAEEPSVTLTSCLEPPLASVIPPTALAFRGAEPLYAETSLKISSNTRIDVELFSAAGLSDIHTTSVNSVPDSIVGPLDTGQGDLASYFASRGGQLWALRYPKRGPSSDLQPPGANIAVNAGDIVNLVGIPPGVGGGQVVMAIVGQPGRESRFNLLQLTGALLKVGPQNLFNPGVAPINAIKGGDVAFAVNGNNAELVVVYGLFDGLYARAGRFSLGGLDGVVAWSKSVRIKAARSGTTIVNYRTVALNFGKAIQAAANSYAILATTSVGGNPIISVVTLYVDAAGEIVLASHRGESPLGIVSATEDATFPPNTWAQIALYGNILVQNPGVLPVEFATGTGTYPAGSGTAWVHPDGAIVVASQKLYATPQLVPVGNTSASLKDNTMNFTCTIL